MIIVDLLIYFLIGLFMSSLYIILEKKGSVI